MTDDQSAHLLEQLRPAGLLELTAWIAFANLAARMNISLGIESKGLSKACSIPLAAPSPRSITA